jgi:acyl-CoA reductase-like NAD-dependent aldehyde dehydrogenase
VKRFYTSFLLCDRRVEKLINGSGEIAMGGRSDARERYIEPTVLTNVKLTDPIMQEEVSFSAFI